MDIVGIIVSVVLGLTMVAVSFYLYTIYCHPEDKGIGTALGSKIVIVLSQSLAWGQLLLIPLDVSNSVNTSGSSTMLTIYSIVYIIIFVMTSLVIPFNIFLYDSDEEDPLRSRVLWSGLFSVAICATWCGFVFISYIWLSKYTVLGVQLQVPVPMYMMLCMAFAGWILLAINAGIGLSYLPYELIRDFFIRPKQITKEEALAEKSQLQNQSQNLINQGELLKKREQELKTESSNWFIKRKNQIELKNKIQHFKKQVTNLEKRFDLFDEELGGIKPVKSKQQKNRQKQAKNQDQQIQKNIKKNQTSPITYGLYLFFGILALSISIVWIIQLVGTTIYIDKKPLFLFLDSPLLNLSTQPGLGFLAVAIYSLLVLYLQGCAVKGNIVFGLQIPFIISFHPMRKDRTLLNSFLFNVNMMMLASIATTQLSVLVFPTYLSTSYLGLFFSNIVKNLPFFGWVFSSRIFLMVMDVIFLMSIVVIIFKSVRLHLKHKKKGD